MIVNPGRIHALKNGAERLGPVVYWMSREQRLRDNWALLYAAEKARGREQPLVTVFCLAPEFLGATRRHFDFMLRGLKHTAGNLEAAGVPFVLLCGEPGREVAGFAAELGASEVVCEFDTLRIKRRWQAGAAEALEVPLTEVDAHNVVPARRASDKKEYAARTIRPKLHRLMDEYLEEFPEFRPPRVAPPPGLPRPDWDGARDSLKLDGSVGPVPDYEPGEEAAAKALHAWVSGGIRGYDQGRNDPNLDRQSELSPYLHFGQLSAQRAALAAASCKAPAEDKEAFLEQLVVRRELAENFCLFEPDYDNAKCWPDWAVETLDEHRGDERQYVYGREEFEAAETHDPLWNAAQTQMVETGKMHGYMRMYWAKKILEWSDSPEAALETSIWLNDRYELDGRDPNGYVGCQWSVAGVHDRPWPERKIFGKVRYMNERGCRRKFDVDEFVRRWLDGKS